MGKHRNGKGSRQYDDGGGTGYKNPPGPKWKPGQSGNPSGRREGERRSSPLEEWARALRDVLESEMPNASSPILVREAIVRRICGEGVQNAKSGIKVIELDLNLDARTARRGELEVEGVAPDDRAILEERLEQLARRHASGSAEAATDGEEEA